MKAHCPKCGADTRSYTQWSCGSSPNFDGSADESVRCVKTQLGRVEAERDEARVKVTVLEARLAAVGEWKKGADYVTCASIEELKELSTKKWAELTAILSDTTPPLAVVNTEVLAVGLRKQEAEIHIPIYAKFGTKVTVVVMGEGK